MLRALIVSLLLVVAAPAQWLGPTNVYLQGAQPDVFVSGGKLYVIVWSASPSSSTPLIELWDKQVFPNRMQVELHMVGLMANDQRPCARLPNDASRLGWNEMLSPVQEWKIEPDGWLWWIDFRSYWRLRANVAHGPSTWFLTYETYTAKWTPCRPVGVPSLIAMLFEVVPL